MSEETPKIVNLADRTPYKVEVEPQPAPGEPDPLTIKALEEALEMAKAGELHGLIAIGWDPVDQEFWRQLTLPAMGEMQTRNVAAMMLGALQMMQDDLKDIAFWTQGYDPLCVYNDEEGA